MSVGRRLALLAACIGLGVLIGLVVRRLTGSDTGFLAAPILVALAWIGVANPRQCMRRDANDPSEPQ